MIPIPQLKFQINPISRMELPHAWVIVWYSDAAKWSNVVFQLLISHQSELSGWRWLVRIIYFTK